MADRPGEARPQGDDAAATIRAGLDYGGDYMPDSAVKGAALAAVGRLVAERDEARENERRCQENRMWASQMIADYKEAAETAEVERDELHARLQAQEQDFGDDRCAFVVVREWCRRPAPTDEGGPGKEEAYWLRAKLRGAITHLRDVEDYYRVQGGLPLGFNMIRADRARDLYEAITEDFVNGSRDRPTRADLRRRVAQLEEALRAAVPYIKWVILTCDSPSDVADAETALKAARAVLAGGTPPPGTADSGDSRAVVAEQGQTVLLERLAEAVRDWYRAHGDLYDGRSNHRDANAGLRSLHRAEKRLIDAYDALQRGHA